MNNMWIELFLLVTLQKWDDEKLMKDRKVAFEIKLLDNLINRKIIENKKDNKKMSHVQASILKYLFENKDKTIYQTDLEVFLNVRRSTISGILKTMEKNNLIKRIDSKNDARKKEITLTDYSIKKSKEMKKKVTLFETLLTKGISYEELEIFFKVIDKLKENVK